MQCAEHKHKVLVVLQAMDTGGKDGVIRKVFSGINPFGIHVASFKAATAAARDHDYLWRVHQLVPARGERVLSNRRHYEDVLITRVAGWLDDDCAKRCFRRISDFEAMLMAEGTAIGKFFCTFPGMNKSSGYWIACTMRRRPGNLISAIWLHARSGTITSVFMTTPSTQRPARLRPGASCRRNATGYVTCLCVRCWSAC